MNTEYTKDDFKKDLISQGFSEWVADDFASSDYLFNRWVKEKECENSPQVFKFALELHQREKENNYVIK